MVTGYSEKTLQHCYGVASVMVTNLGNMYSCVPPETAYTVGLLHDIGTIWNGWSDNRDEIAKLGFEYVRTAGLTGNALDAIRYCNTSGFELIDGGQVDKITPLLLLLQFADMTVTDEGRVVQVCDRLDEIRKRTCDGSDKYENAMKIAMFLGCIFDYELKDDLMFIKPITKDEIHLKVSAILQERKAKVGR